MMKRSSLLLLCLVLLWLAGCGGAETPSAESPPDVTASEGPVLEGISLNDSVKTLLGGTLAEVSRQYGERRVYYDYAYGFYSAVDEADLVFFFELPKLRREEAQDPINSLNLALESDFAYYYDFATGAYTPADFVATSVAIRGKALQEMFGMAAPVTLHLVNGIFAEPYKLHRGYDEGEPYLLAGPFALEDVYLSFTIYDPPEVVYATAYAAFPPLTFTAYFGGYNSDGNVLLTESLSEEAQDAAYTGDWWYELTPELQTRLEAEPLHAGEPYTVMVNEANVLTEIEMIR